VGGCGNLFPGPGAGAERVPPEVDEEPPPTPREPKRRRGYWPSQ
jgi:hypothetical protein